MALSGLLQEQPRTVALYAGFAVCCLITYRVLQARATGAYDYLLTLSAGLQALAFAMLALSTRSNVGEGLSEKMLWALIVAHVTRLSTTFWGEGYVPEDNTSDVCLYQIVELSGVVMLLLKLTKLTAARTAHDVGQGVERWSLVVGMGVASLILAWATKSTGHNDYYADFSWMFAVWMEAFAIAPQIYVLWSATHVDESAAHFAGLTLAASLVFGFFWGRTARDRFAEFEKGGEHSFFVAILVASAIRVLLCSAYLYLFVRSSRGGKGKLGPKGEYELCNQDEL